MTLDFRLLPLPLFMLADSMFICGIVAEVWPIHPMLVAGVGAGCTVVIFIALALFGKTSEKAKFAYFNYLRTSEMNLAF